MYTISMNSMGHIHVWQGRRHIDMTNRLNHKDYNPKWERWSEGLKRTKGESELYFQDGSDIQAIKEVLTASDWKNLNDGYTVRRHKYNYYFSNFSI